MRLLGEAEETVSVAAYNFVSAKKSLRMNAYLGVYSDSQD